jgi:hypothetical protein
LTSSVLGGRAADTAITSKVATTLVRITPSLPSFRRKIATLTPIACMGEVC